MTVSEYNADTIHLALLGPGGPPLGEGDGGGATPFRPYFSNFLSVLKSVKNSVRLNSFL